MRRADASIQSLGVAACLLAILGAKIWLVRVFAVDMPIWDQWSGEGLGIYLPYLEGRLSLTSFIDFHTQHRIVFTRTLGLALLILNGSWDPILGMLVNSLVHLAAIFLILRIVRPLLGVGDFLLFAGFILLLFAVPFGWSNTLSAFQVQFYALLLLALLGLSFLYRAPAWSTAWWIGTAFGVLSYFTTASGALTLLAFAALASLQFALGQRRHIGEAMAILVHVAITVALVLDVPSSGPRPESMQREIVSQLYASLVAAASWPIASYSWPLALRWVLPLLMQLPSIWLTWQLIARRAPLADRNWALVAAMAWVGTQIVALAVARTGDTGESRYADILVIGVAINFACLLQWLRTTGQPAATRATRVIAVVWLAAIFLGGGQKAIDNIPLQLRATYEMMRVERENLSQFLITGDYAHLRDKPELEIPYPDAEVLRMAASNPLMRSILPPELMGKPRPRRPRDAALAAGPMLVPVGALLLMLAILGALRWAGSDVGPPARGPAQARTEA